MRCREQMPGFAVAFERTAAGAVRADADSLASTESRDGDDVPGVAGDEVSGEDIYCARRVGTLAAVSAAGLDLEKALLRNERRLDLHAAKMATAVHDEIVTGAVAAGAGDGEPEGESAADERNLGIFALMFGGGEEH